MRPTLIQIMLWLAGVLCAWNISRHLGYATGLIDGRHQGRLECRP